MREQLRRQLMAQQAQLAPLEAQWRAAATYGAANTYALQQQVLQLQGAIQQTAAQIRQLDAQAARQGQPPNIPARQPGASAQVGNVPPQGQQAHYRAPAPGGYQPAPGGYVPQPPVQGAAANGMPLQPLRPMPRGMPPLQAQAYQQQPVYHPVQGQVHPAPLPAAGGSVEQKIGGRIIGIAGIVFILVGVVLGLRYTYVNLLQSDVLRTGLAYLLGAVFLIGGEVMARKLKTTHNFAQYLVAGGIGILFATTAVAYFSLGVFSILSLAAATLVVTAVALLLSVRYASQLIAIFALAGGYIPILFAEDFMFAPAGVMLVAKVYTLVLTGFVMVLSLRRNWQVLRGVGVLLQMFFSTWLFALQRNLRLEIDGPYLLLALVSYTVILLVYPIRNKQKAKVLDVILLSIYSFVTVFTLMPVIDAARVYMASGLVLLVFSVLYFIGGNLLKKFLPGLRIRAVFYALSYAFFLLGSYATLYELERTIIWPSIGFHIDIYPFLVLTWMLAALALGLYGVLKNKPWFIMAAGGLTAISALRLMLVDIPGYWRSFVAFYNWRPVNNPISTYLWLFGIFVLVPLVVVFAGLRRGYAGHPKLRYLWACLRVLSVANLWVYLLWLCHFVAYPFVDSYSRNHTVLTAMAVLSLLLPVLFRRIKRLEGRSMRVLGAVIAGFGLVFTLLLNGWDFNAWSAAMNIGILLLLNVLVAIVMLWLLDELGATWNVRSMLLAIYLTVVVTQLALVQLQADFTSMLLSFVYLGLALAAVIMGFAAKLVFLRRYGLGLTIAAVSKFFLLDLSFQESWQRIVSWLVFGFVLLGISFLYQVYSKKYGEAPPPRQANVSPVQYPAYPYQPPIYPQPQMQRPYYGKPSGQNPYTYAQPPHTGPVAQHRQAPPQAPAAMPVQPNKPQQ